MGLSRIFSPLRSLRLTIALLVVLAILLLLNVAIPQESLLGREAFASRLAAAGPVYRFVLVDLGLGRMAVSPVFLGVLGLFFLNLLSVIGMRIGPTIRRVQIKPRAEAGLKAWTGMEESLTGELPAGWSSAGAENILKGFGYQVRQAGTTALWGVRHRTAALGFLAFHLSFLLLCAGGVMLYYTRFVGTVVLVEGQEFSGSYQNVSRQAPMFEPPSLWFSLREVTPLYEAGFPMQLGAVFRFPGENGFEEEEAWINHPVVQGSTTLLVTRAGLAPVFWLQDQEGFTVDHVSIVSGSLQVKPTVAQIGGETVEIVIHPLDRKADFPSRKMLPATSLDLQVTTGGGERVEVSLKPGQALNLESGRLVLEELRYWVAIQVVDERGGGLLIAGFILGIAGLIWRLMWYRREVALTWDESRFRMTGRGEYFSHRFHEELKSIREILATGSSRATGES